MGIGLLTLIIITGLVTYKGLKLNSFFKEYLFEVDQILIAKDYKRMVTAGFLHLDWRHFTFNMITLFLFGDILEAKVGLAWFLGYYLISLVGGNLLALYIHRNHGDYSAAGASGAVCGIVFATIGLFPGMEVGSLFIPIHIPSWVYGLLYTLYTIYSIQTQRDHIGHEAHLGGGVAGLLLAIALNPSVLQTNYIAISAILVPTLVFWGIIIYKPHWIMIKSSFTRTKGVMNIDDHYRDQQKKEQDELDRLLDKINEKGLDNLSKKEKERLRKLSER